MEGEQLAATDVMVADGGGGGGGEGGVGLDGLDCTVIVAAPDFEPSCVLVAVTVITPGEAGAVNNPLDAIVPPLADHATAELKLPVPCTDAVHCDVAPGAMVLDAQLTATEDIPDETEENCVPLLPPPQADIAIRPRKAIRTKIALYSGFLLLLCRNLFIDMRRAGHFDLRNIYLIWMPA